MAEMSWLLLKKSNRFPLLIYNGTSFAPLGIHEFVCHAIVHYSYIIQCSLDACLRLIQDRIDSVTFCDGSVICQEYVLSYCCSRLLLLFFFFFRSCTCCCWCYCCCCCCCCCCCSWFISHINLTLNFQVTVAHKERPSFTNNLGTMN